MPLYAIKEAADKLKTVGTPAPSSSCPAGSFRNLVEQHRDEKDLTWGQLFNLDDNQDRHLSNVRRDPAEHHHIVVDLEDGVRRCSRCAWEIGPNGICEGCQTRYAALDTDDSDDESFRAHHEDSEDMGTNYGTDGEEDHSVQEARMRDHVAYFWRRPIGRSPGESGTDDGASMTRMVSQVGDESEDNSSDVQVVRRGRLVFRDSDSDGEGRRPAARWRVAAAAPSGRAVSIGSGSSSVHSDRPHYSPSHDPSMGSATEDEDDEPDDGPLGGYRAGPSMGRGRSLPSLEGYSSNQSDAGTPVLRSPTTHGGSSDMHSDSDHVAVRSSSSEPDPSDDDLHSDRYSHGGASSSNDDCIHSAASFSNSSHSDFDDQDDSDYSGY